MSEKTVLDTLVEEQCVVIGKKRYEVRAWSIAKVKGMLPVLSAAMAEMKKRNALPLRDDMFDEVVQVVSSDPAVAIDSIGVFLPLLVSGVAITLDVEESVVEEMGLAEVVAVSLLIFKQNVTYLKNFFGPQVQQITKMLMS